ncbi:MAG: PAC2 family protein [Chloroflexota bacterium]|nr:PAC2 family protein [Chloroflexota bacterium]
MPFVQYHTQPALRSPIVIAALAGWNDAADAATTTIKFLIERWKPVTLAEIDGEEFFVFTETRPTIRITEGVQRTITWPTNQFLGYQAPELEHDIILYLGSEPQLKWRTFSGCFLEICKQFQVSEVLLLGALLADVPHSMEVPITGAASNEELLERLHEIDIHSSRYEGPTGMIGILQDVCRQSHIPVASLWAAAPHYIAATPNVKVTAALLTYLNTFLSLDLDLNTIQSDSVHFEEQITALVARDPDASAYVHKLEEQVTNLLNEDDDEDDEDNEAIIDNLDKPASSGPLPSADALIRSVEELLRNERENGNPQSNDEQESE